MSRAALFMCAVSLSFALAGCAALFSSKSTAVQMNSNPAGADVFINGNRVGSTPMSLDLSNKESHSITFRMAGRSDVTCLLNRKVGVGWVVLDVLGGLVPIVIDAATGSWYQLEKNACNATFGSPAPTVDLQQLTDEQRMTYGGIF